MDLAYGDKPIKKIMYGGEQVRPKEEPEPEWKLKHKLNFDTNFDEVYNNGWGYTTTNKNGLIISGGYLIPHQSGNDNRGYISKSIGVDDKVITRFHSQSSDWSNGGIYIYHGDNRLSYDIGIYPISYSKYRTPGQINKIIGGTSTTLKQLWAANSIPNEWQLITFRYEDGRRWCRVERESDGHIYGEEGISDLGDNVEIRVAPGIGNSNEIYNYADRVEFYTLE